MLPEKIFNKIKNKNLNDVIAGSVWSLLSRVVATVLGLLGTIFLARVYGAESVGLIAIINSILMMATILCLLGFNTSILRLIPEYKVRYSLVAAFHLYRKIVYLVAVAAIATSLSLYYFSSYIAETIFSDIEYEFYIELVSCFVVFKALSRINTQAIRALDEIRVFAVVQLLPQLVNLILFVSFWYFLQSYNAPVYALFSSLIITAFVSWLLVNRHFSDASLDAQKNFSVSSKKLMGITLPMMTTGVITIICGESGVILLSIYGDETDVGIYSVAFKLATLTGFLLRATNTILAPRISKLKYSNDINEMFFVIKNISKLIFWISTPILMVMLIFGEWILELFFGFEFVAGYSTLCFLLLGSYINAITGPTGIFLNMTGQQKLFRNITLIGALIFFASNIVLIPLLGMLGAAISLFIAEIIWNFSCLFYIKHKYGKTTGYFPGLSG